MISTDKINMDNWVPDPDKVYNYTQIPIELIDWDVLEEVLVGDTMSADEFKELKERSCNEKPR